MQAEQSLLSGLEPEVTRQAARLHELVHPRDDVTLKELASGRPQRLVLGTEESALHGASWQAWAGRPVLLAGDRPRYSRRWCPGGERIGERVEDDTTQPRRLLDRLLGVLDLTPQGTDDRGQDVFTGPSQPQPHGRVFGGQVLGQR